MPGAERDTVTRAIDALASGQDIPSDHAAAVLAEIMSGNASEAQIAAFLIALRTKGETVDEIAGLARTMRDMAAHVAVHHTQDDLLDVVGTGGGRQTFNVSTTAALIAAGAGCTVAKHGNRSATGLSGAADVLEALGARIDIDPAAVGRCVDSVGFGFMFAPTHHAATRHVIPVRRALAVRTIFNFLGPLTNPAGVTRQLTGVADRRYLDAIAGAFARLGAAHVLVVSSDDGLDELLHVRAQPGRRGARRRDRPLRRRRGGGRARRGPAGRPQRRHARGQRRDRAPDPRRRARRPARRRGAERGRRDLRGRSRGDARGGRARGREGDRLRRRRRRAGALRHVHPGRREGGIVSVNTLERIVDSTRREVEQRRDAVPLATLEQQLIARGEDRPFTEALVHPGISVIAEHKRRSPSAGPIREGASVADVVCAYERAGAAALSVLTEGPHFGGSLDDLRAARAATRLPILRKDFVVDHYQLFESAAVGADAILLIVAALDPRELTRLHHEALALDLDVLVEVHDARELEVALELDADVIGINNRDLADFSVDVQRTFELLADVPAGKTVVSESGIATREQLDELERVGVDAVLVGEALMRAADVEAACRALTEQGEDRAV